MSPILDGRSSQIITGAPTNTDYCADRDADKVYLDIAHPVGPNAMVFHRPGAPLICVDRPMPKPGSGQIRLRVNACGV